ncbi:Hypoxanthine-guanine phosphoribosyltransferase, partial [hydrothermal vent metagenome]
MNGADPCLVEAQQVLKKADLMYSAKQIDQAISQLAERINRQFANTSQAVIVIPIMNGGLVLSGHLISRLEFPLLVDYLHATRYRNKTSGTDLQWIAKPQLDLTGKIVLIIDDILDEGHTLSEVLSFCAEQGAEQVCSAVLVEKNHGRKVPQ